MPHKSPAEQLIEMIKHDGFENTVSNRFNRHVSGMTIKVEIARYSRKAIQTYANYRHDILEPVLEAQSMYQVTEILRAAKTHDGSLALNGNLVLEGKDLTLTITPPSR